MSIIEEAAKRLQELRRAGIDLPLSAAGLSEGESSALLGDERAADGPGGSRALPVVNDAIRRSERYSRLEGERRSRQVDLDLAKLQAAGLLVPGAPRSQLENEFRVIKRPLLKNISEARGQGRSNLIMVTSALPGEGKTFTAVNLAMSMATELDHTVLLVDADVLRPAVLDRLGLPHRKGLVDALADPTLDLSEVLLRTNVPKLVLMPAGMPASMTTEMMASTTMDELLDEMAQCYADRIIIFDAPPLLLSTESRVLASKVGQIVMVVEAGRTSKSAVADAFAMVEQCPIVLSVLNKVPYSALSSSYGSYGGYGYGPGSQQQ